MQVGRAEKPNGVTEKKKPNTSNSKTHLLTLIWRDNVLETMLLWFRGWGHLEEAVISMELEEA